MSKPDPEWLPETRVFCRQAGINIMAWGPNLLTVEAKSPEKAKEISYQLGQVGFQVVEDEADAEAGMLNLSRNPDAVRAQIAAFNQKHKK